MWGKLRTLIELILYYVFTTIAGFMDSIELEWLQKTFYMLSIVLLLVAMGKVIKGGRMNLEKMTSAASTAEQVLYPESKATYVVRLIRSFKKGGINMFGWAKRLSVTQIVSFVITVVLILLGVLSVLKPELSPFSEYIVEILVFAGFSAAPGILSFGKELGEKAKRVKEAKDKKHALLKELKSIDNDIKTITALNTDVIEAVNRINKLHAGALTAEQQIRYDSYEAQQKALKARTDEIELEVNSLNTIINDSGGVLNG
jgi:hypothetical protein